MPLNSDSRLFEEESRPFALWMQALGKSEADAQTRVWNRHAAWVRALARNRLKSVRCREFDEEDIVSTTFAEFFQAFARFRYPLQSEQELRTMLKTFAVRRISAEFKRINAERRGPGQVRGESLFHRNDHQANASLQQLQGNTATPEQYASWTEHVQKLLNQLDKSLRTIASLRLLGYTVAEIAGQLQCAPRTVERKLALIRSQWEVQGPKTA